MCVDVSGGRKGAVPQPFLNLLHGYAVHHHQAGAAVAQVVKTDVLQPVLGQQPIKVLRHEVRADQLAFLIGADEIQIFALGTLGVGNRPAADSHRTIGISATPSSL